MRKIVLAAVAALVLPAAANAATLGLQIGTGSATSGSTAVAASQGSSGSAIIGATTQTSGAHADSAGIAGNQITNGIVLSESQHVSNTAQTGNSASIGLAGSQNSNFALGAGASAATGSHFVAGLFLVP